MKPISLFQFCRNLTLVTIVLAGSYTLSAQVGESGPPFPGLTEEPSIGFELVEYQKNPVIGKDHPDCKDNKYGFEGGLVIKLKKTYHMFTAENHGDPRIVRMRIAHWTSPDALDWKRQSTIVETTGEPIEVTGRAYASIWQPTPVFNEAENRWDMFCVAYKKSGTGKGFILRFQSTVAGRDGIAGPYKELGIIMQPDRDSQIWEGYQGVATFNPFQVSKRKWLAFYGSAGGHHPEGWLVGLASAPALSGPWKRLPEGNPVLIESVFMENPIVTRIGNLYVIVYDSDVQNPIKRSYFFENHSVGYATSKDGIHWSKGGRITVQPKGEANWSSDIRTPLGLVDEGNGLYTLVYTADSKGDFKSVGMVKVKLVQKNSKAPVTTAFTKQSGLISPGDPARIQAEDPKTEIQYLSGHGPKDIVLWDFKIDNYSPSCQPAKANGDYHGTLTLTFADRRTEGVSNPSESTQSDAAEVIRPKFPDQAELTSLLQTALIGKGDKSRIIGIMKSALQGKELMIMGIGTSIMAGANASNFQKTSLSPLVYDWWVSKFPTAKFKFINAGMGASSAVYAVHRAERDILKFNPDFTLIDYTAPDRNYEPEGLEGLVRKMLIHRPQSALLSIVQGGQDFVSVPDIHVAICENYGIPILSVPQIFLPLLKSGRLVWKDWSTDTIHPSDSGHAMIADLIISFLEECYKEAISLSKSKRIRKIKPPITKNGFAKSAVYDASSFTPDDYGNWTLYRDSSGWNNSWAANAEDQPMVFKVKAKSLIFGYRKTIKPTNGRLIVKMDGKQLKIIDPNFPKGWGDFIPNETVFKEDKAEKHTIEFIYGGSPGEPILIKYLLIAE